MPGIDGMPRRSGWWGLDAGQQMSSFISGRSPGFRIVCLMAPTPVATHLERARRGSQFALGWAYGQYRFERYKRSPRRAVSLALPEHVDRLQVEPAGCGVQPRA